MDMLLRYWAPLEADFERYYQISEPLVLSWRKFMVLFRGLPPDSAFISAAREELMFEQMSPTERIDYLRENQNSKLSIDQFVKEAT